MTHVWQRYMSFFTSFLNTSHSITGTPSLESAYRLDFTRRRLKQLTQLSVLITHNLKAGVDCQPSEVPGVTTLIGIMLLTIFLLAQLLMENCIYGTDM